MTSTLDNVPQLIHHTTLRTPTAGIRTWSSQAHPSSHSPLLATATSDKSVHIWDMRDWRLLSTIAGGHKRSIRCVGWKDFGQPSKRLKTSADSSSEPKPVILATGSFDANVGLWEWNPKQQDTERVPGAFEEEERDFTNEEEEEEWNFGTLLTGPDSEIKDLQFSPSHYGANLLATCSRDKSVWVWEEAEPEEWETVAVLSEHTGDVKCVQWLSGARTSRAELRRRLDGNEQETGDEEEEEIILGQRELLASGSYDDTIRLHHDDEAEGDWLTIAVLTGHDGTVWDLKFESYVGLAQYPAGTTTEEVVVDWRPRLLSCSDDMTLRLWKKVLTEKEEDERKARLDEVRRGQRATEDETEAAPAPPTGFSGRIPSTIRPPTSSEKWREAGQLPNVHVRSVYAIDWSSKTGLIVSCGGDGLIAVYQEVAANNTDDVVMNGTGEAHDETDLKRLKTEWKVVASIEAAHDEYEINHVCWAPRRDVKQHIQLNGETTSNADESEEYIVSTGDDGQVRVWRLPDELRKSHP